MCLFCFTHFLFRKYAFFSLFSINGKQFQTHIAEIFMVITMQQNFRGCVNFKQPAREWAPFSRNCSGLQLNHAIDRHASDYNIFSAWKTWARSHLLRLHCFFTTANFMLRKWILYSWDWRTVAKRHSSIRWPWATRQAQRPQSVSYSSASAVSMNTQCYWVT